ncbi:MAG: hypothetical protein UX10_C0002G0005 [Candidatus Magasanikbacteria bacterium GW2011_GWA2_45_39]|uniref:Uncharacterized protein n=1 Tax=Candidatus Magasanikbacteria bacterium GW2011_GWA2_45_39 TaxID=1619041 RepID=A0A0G1MID0_9BACT|nr:MAG: hypothetical protein UX10_C0002G0005 [Candidatus Magasanikbacteria bacterium GW2011_GWA2_45_39]
MSKMPSMSRSLPKAVAQGAFLNPLRDKGYSKTQVRIAQKLAQQNTSAKGGVSADQLKSMQLLRRRLANQAGTPTVSHAIARKIFAGEQATEHVLSAAGKTHFLKTTYRNPNLTAAQVERRALKSFVSQQKAPDDKAEMLKKTTKVYQAQRAKESGEVSSFAGTDRGRLQKMEEDRERGEYASEVLKSAETGQPVDEKGNQNDKHDSAPAIPFARNSDS